MNFGCCCPGYLPGTLAACVLRHAGVSESSTIAGSVFVYVDYLIVC